MMRDLKVMGIVVMVVGLAACGRSDGGSATTAPTTTQGRVKQHLENAGREIEQAATEVGAQAKPELEKAATEARELAHRVAEEAAHATSQTQPASRPATQP